MLENVCIINKRRKHGKGVQGRTRWVGESRAAHGIVFTCAPWCYRCNVDIRGYPANKMKDCGSFKHRCGKDQKGA